MNKIVELKTEETKAVTGGNRYDIAVARPMATSSTLAASFNQTAVAQSLLIR
jgi:hypothetical protein